VAAGQKYRGAFPGAFPLLHALFASEAAAGQRASRVVGAAQQAAEDAVASAGAAAAASAAAAPAPASGAGTTTGLAAATAPSTDPGRGSGGLHEPKPPTPKAPAAPPAGHAAASTGVGSRGERVAWRDPGTLTGFLEASVGGLVDLPLDQVVSLASMFNWADSRQRDVVEVLQGLARGARLCLKAALPDPRAAHGNTRDDSGNRSGGGGIDPRAGTGAAASGAARWRRRSDYDSSSGEGVGVGVGSGSGRGRSGRSDRQALFVEQTRDWSHGFSLDALNIDQSLALHCWVPDPSGGSGGSPKLLELGFVSRPAPGRLGLVGTRVAYFYPRFVVVNLLERSLALVQPEPRGWGNRDPGPGGPGHDAASGRSSGRYSSSSAGNGSGGSGLPRDRAAHVAPFEWAPFQLPFARAKRQVALDLGEAYQRSARLPLDQIGEFTVALRRQAGISDRDRVKVQAEYDVHYPYGGSGSSSSGGSGSSSGSGRRPSGGTSNGPGGTGASNSNGGAGGALAKYADGLGLWLETDVENDCVVVRKVKPKSYADVEEDVRPGDQVRDVKYNLPKRKMHSTHAFTKSNNALGF